MLSLFPVARRAAAVGILILLLAGLWMGGVQPVYVSWAEARQQNSQAERLLAAYQQAVREKVRWEAARKELQGDKYRRLFLNADDANLAGARLQAAVKQHIEGTGGVIQSIQVLPAVKVHDLRRVSVRVDWSTPLARLAELLQKVEQAVPSVFVDDVVVAAPEGGQEGAAKPVVLSLRANFSAYLPPEAP